MGPDDVRALTLDFAAVEIEVHHPLGKQAALRPGGFIITAILPIAGTVSTRTRC
jgi:hypothetical protein